jgi:hypothetical protein
MVGNWFVTPHAVRRYIERVDGSLSYEQALAELVCWSQKARRVKELRPGVWLYRGGKPKRLRFRVAENDNGAPQLLTVMGGKDRGW